MTVRRHRRYSTEFKIQLVQAYLDGEGSARSIATRHEVPHSLLMVWIKKYEAGDLTREIHLQEEVVEYGAKIAALERKIGQLTMELDVMKKRALIRPSRARRAAVDHLRSRGVPIRRGCSLMNMARSTFYKTTACGPPGAAREKADSEICAFGSKTSWREESSPPTDTDGSRHELRRRGNLSD